MPESKFNPAYDNKIFQKYSKKTIENKIKNKTFFCDETGLIFDKRIPIICITYPLTDNNNVSMLQDIMNGVLEQPIQLVLTSIGTQKYQQYFTDLSEKYNDKINIADNNGFYKRKIYAASDIIIIPTLSEECVEEAKFAMAYGVIPVIPPADFAENYNPNMEKGNAFVYIKDSPWSLFATLIRALESFRFPYDWKNIQVSAMETE